MAIRVTSEERKPAVAQQPAVASPFRLFEELFNDWFTRASEFGRTEGFRPAVDVLEKQGNLILRIEVPGVSEKDLELKLEGQVLSVSGEKKMEPEYESSSYYRVESCCGRFSRSFTLPDTVDTDRISADYKNGILTITLPQKPEARPRQIPVSTK